MSKEEYDDIVRFIAQEKHMKNSEAFDSQDKFEVWHAGDDDDEEGIFLNWYTLLTYLLYSTKTIYHNVQSGCTFTINIVCSIFLVALSLFCSVSSTMWW